jgi:hypothetical protein
MSIDQNLGAVTASGSRQVFPSQTTTYYADRRSARPVRIRDR